MAKIIGLLTLLYPLAVYFGVQYFPPWIIAALLMGLLSIRWLIQHKQSSLNRQMFLLAMGYCIYAIWNNDILSLRFYPVLINLGLLTVFAASLRYPPPIIERLARIQHPDLPPEGILYTRKVTRVWCVFFLFNGLMALITALYCSLECWSLYNGMIAYILMGLLMGIEYLIRFKTQSHVR